LEGIASAELWPPDRARNGPPAEADSPPDAHAELRLDYLRNPRERTVFLAMLAKQAAARHSDCDMPLASRWRAFQRLTSGAARGARTGCARWVPMCDVEIEAARDWPAAQRRRDLRPARVLVSFHDFSTHPAIYSRWRCVSNAPVGDAIKDCR